MGIPNISDYLEKFKGITPPDEVVRKATQKIVKKITQWSEIYAPEKTMGLNMILTNGQDVYGSRIGRSLFYTIHKGIYSCEICGFPHIHHEPSVGYRAIDIASEPVTHDDWVEIPEKSLFHVDDCFNLQVTNI